METRRAKRYRKAHTLTTTSIAPTTENYFNMLTPELHEIIIRYVSSRPNHERYRAYITPQDAVTLLQQPSNISNVARAHLTTLHIHFAYAPPRNHIARGIQMERATDESIFLDLLNEQSPRLRMLTLDMGYKHRFNNGDVFEYCHNLRKLSLGFRHHLVELDPILRACGSKLIELQLSNELHLPSHHVDSIITHCTSIETLILDHETTDTSLIPLWQKLGDTLRKVSFQPPRIGSSLRSSSNYRSELTSMAKICGNLTDIELMHGGKNYPSACLLTSLGNQLTTIRFMLKDTCPEPTILNEIITQCPKAKFHVFIHKNAEVTLSLLGCRLHTLKLRHNFVSSEALSSIVKKLTNLVDLTLLLKQDSFDFSTIFLMANTYEKLIKLNINRVSFDAGRNIIRDILGESTIRTIRDFECTTTTALNSDITRSFLTKNKGIRRVWITNKIRDGNRPNNRTNVMVCVCSIIKMLDEIPSIKELVMKDTYTKNVSSSIRDACVKLRSRRRDLDVIVGDVRYLPMHMKLIRKRIQY